MNRPMAVGTLGVRLRFLAIALLVVALLGGFLADVGAAVAEADAVTMVVGDAAALSAGDDAVEGRLIALGYDVTLVDDSAATPAHAAGAAFVFIASSVNAGTLGSAFADVAVPVWVTKPWLLDDMGMTGVVPSVDYGTLKTATVTVESASHPLAAGLTGEVTVTTKSKTASFGEPGSAAAVVTSAGGRTSGFVYSTGDTLADGSTAAGCRIHTSVYHKAPLQFGTEGWQLFDATVGFAAAGCTAPAAGGPFVVLISVDGLRAGAVSDLGPVELPNLHRFETEGGTTGDARSMFDSSRTLPNHTSMLTGAPVLGADGHGVTFNEDDGSTLHVTAGRYVAGAFDVVHDHGGTTAMYVGKTKFDFLDRSWNETNGALDTTGADNGRDKIDHYQVDGGSATTADVIATLAVAPYDFTFVHFAALDATGHEFGWESPEYDDALREVDGYVGQILDTVEQDVDLAGLTTVILTGDHGGTGTSHGDAAVLTNVTIPFYVWGAGVTPGTDLYALNPVVRLAPGNTIPDHDAVPQPIRNGDAGNLALDVLGFGSIPSSTINALQDLAIEGFALQPVLMVVGDAGSLSASDQAVHDRLASQGLSVDLVSDEVATAGLAASASLVFVSSSVNSNILGDELVSVARPVWVAKPWSLDDFGLTGPEAGVDYGKVKTDTIVVVDPDHPLAAGLGGAVAIMSTPRSVSFGVPGTAADVVTTAKGLPTAFLYGDGETLADGSTAQGCRIHAPVFASSVLAWNADAWALFDAAAAYGVAGCE